MKQELIKRKTKIKDYTQKPLSKMATKVSDLYYRTLWSLTFESIVPFSKRDNKHYIDTTVTLPFKQEHKAGLRYVDMVADKYSELEAKTFYSLQVINRYKVSSSDIKITI